MHTKATDTHIPKMEVNDMTSSNCCTPRCSCTVLAVVGSILVGIVTAVLVTTATVVLTPAFLWVLLGTSVGLLPFLLLYAALARREFACTCRALTATLVGILGTVLFAILLLGITLPATGFLLPFFAGLALFFFALTLSSLVCLIRCTSGCGE